MEKPHSTDWKLGYAESALIRIIAIIDNEINPFQLSDAQRSMIDKVYGVAERALGEIK